MPLKNKKVEDQKL